MTLFFFFGGGGGDMQKEAQTCHGVQEGLFLKESCCHAEIVYCE
jgi:hypothetical protein